ncbi:unnamed protein product [Withania somnifera]
MSCSSSSEDEDEGFDSYRKGGYHAVRVGDSFAGGRYIAQRKLGWGEFSTVWLAYDTRSSGFVALKIQKSAQQFAQAALHEIEVLSAIVNGEPSNCKYVVRLIDHFKHTGPNGQHLCMVLEFRGDSLLRLIEHNRCKGLDASEICNRVLTDLDYLHRGLGIIHTDLKLENILLLSTTNKKLKQRARREAARISGRWSFVGGVGGTPKPNRSPDGIDLRCKVVDFGNDLRSHEVILHYGYSFYDDMWSFMMFTPKVGEGFAMMMELLGKIPRMSYNPTARSKDYFDRHGDLKRIRRLKYGCLDKLLVDKHRFSESDAHEFTEFVGPLLDFEPEKRPTAEQCLRHQWLNFKILKQSELKSESGVEKVNSV